MGVTAAAAMSIKPWPQNRKMPSHHTALMAAIRATRPDIWQQRFDELAAIAQTAGVPSHDIVSVRSRTVQSLHVASIHPLLHLQRAHWPQDMSNELFSRILGFTSQAHVRMCSMVYRSLHGILKAIRPIQFVRVRTRLRITMTAESNSCMCITPGGQLLAWGSNDFGELGLGDKENRAQCAEPAMVKGLLGNKAPVQIDMADMHTVCAASNGTLFSWGADDFGALGQSVTNQPHETPVLVGGKLEGKIVVQASVGQLYTTCITADGQVFSWGKGDHGQLGLCNDQLSVRRSYKYCCSPALVNLSGRVVLQVDCGSSFTLCRTRDNQIYGWGSNMFGQLGLGHTSSMATSTPTLVPVPEIVPTHLCCGGFFSMCVNADGTLYAWGSSSHGALGLGERTKQFQDENVVSPMAVAGPLERKAVLQVAAGRGHTLCLTTDGELWAMGLNSHGQLGLGDQDSRLNPTLVTALNGKVVTQVAAGDASSFCVTSDGCMLAWGKGAYGQLGLRPETGGRSANLDMGTKVNGKRGDPSGEWVEGIGWQTFIWHDINLPTQADALLSCIS